MRLTWILLAVLLCGCGQQANTEVTAPVVPDVEDPVLQLMQAIVADTQNAPIEMEKGAMIKAHFPAEWEPGYFPPDTSGTQ